MLGLSVRQFVAATAAKTPIPGGGSVAGVVGALATALGEMALAFSRGKKNLAGFEADHERLAVHLARARGMFLDLTGDDAAAYSLYQESAKGDDAAAKATALAAAINVPREMTALALTVLGELADLSGKCNRHLLSDLAAAAVLAEAVVTLSDYNVRVNAACLPDADVAGQLCAASARDRQRAAGLRASIESVFQV
jgi:formiminotetrahydrofolate cyclodeaminase